MKKHKNIILVVSAILLITATVLTFLIWQSVKLSNDLKNNPETQINNKSDDKNYNLEDKDTSWDSDDSSLSSGSSSDSDKKTSSTDNKKGNGSGNDATTDKTPTTLAPIDQSNGTTNVDGSLACSAAQITALNNQISAIDQDVQKRSSAARAEGVRINNLLGNQNTAAQGQSELTAYKASHNDLTPQEEADRIFNEGEEQKKIISANSAATNC